MIINAKTTSDLEAKLEDIRQQCEDIERYIDAYLQVIRMDDEDQDAGGYYRMVNIIESKVQDLAR